MLAVTKATVGGERAQERLLECVLGPCCSEAAA